MTDIAIKIEHLNYVYSPGTAYEKHALKDICLEIPHGEFVGIIGHTGSGKSTLIQHLNGLVKATDGALYYNGENIYQNGYDMRALRNQVGLVFQYPEYQLFEIDVLTDVCFGPKNQGLSKEECEKRALEALKLVGLKEKYYKSSPFELSGGQKRRVAIAGVLAMRPKVLVLDEPTAGLDPKGRDDILDQVKRLHEYKRQLLNILHVIGLYNRLKMNPGLDLVPRTFIFGAKAAAGYHRAKLIIKLINAVADVVNNDPTIHGRIKVVFMENYRVSLAEKMIPAADVSEQISTAGKEASGTGNMKFMLNGALTIGTMDGANVEICEEVGRDNIFIFGMSAAEVQQKTQEGYDPWMVYNMNQEVRMALTSLIDGTFDPDTNLFRELYDALLNGCGGRADEYFVLEDYADYARAQWDIDRAYRDEEKWVRMAILNTAESGKFSSDRTIRQYADEIWQLPSVEIV